MKGKRQKEATKTLTHLGWIDADDEEGAGFELNVVFDHCPRQNKKNHVLRLIPYLVEMCHFENVNFVFLGVGHTKKAADQMFN